MGKIWAVFALFGNLRHIGRRRGWDRYHLIDDYSFSNLIQGTARDCALAGFSFPPALNPSNKTYGLTYKHVAKTGSDENSKLVAMAGSSRLHASFTDGRWFLHPCRICILLNHGEKNHASCIGDSILPFLTNQGRRFQFRDKERSKATFHAASLAPSPLRRSYSTAPRYWQRKIGSPSRTRKHMATR